MTKPPKGPTISFTGVVSRDWSSSDLASALALSRMSPVCFRSRSWTSPPSAPRRPAPARAASSATPSASSSCRHGRSSRGCLPGAGAASGRAAAVFSLPASWGLVVQFSGSCGRLPADQGLLLSATLTAAAAQALAILQLTACRLGRTSVFVLGRARPARRPRALVAGATLGTASTSKLWCQLSSRKTRE